MTFLTKTLNRDSYIISEMCMTGDICIKFTDLTKQVSLLHLYFPDIFKKLLTNNEIVCSYKSAYIITNDGTYDNQTFLLHCRTFYFAT